jgi:glycosyltransferase involved in cell wall biosynthesis
VTSGLQGLRVLAFCDYLSPDSSGGAERVAMETYPRLARQGAAVRIITTMPASMRPAVLAGVEVESAPLVDLSAAVRLQVGISPVLFARLRSLADFHADVLHAHTLFFQTSLAAALFQRMTHTPLVTTVHVGSLEMMGEPGRTVSQAYEASVGRFILSRSARIVAVSPSVRTHLLRLGAKPDRVTVAPNGVDLERFHPRPGGMAPTAPPLLAFVGRLIEVKGPDVMLTALLRLHADGVPFRAIFFGDGPMRARLESQARAAGAPVVFAGHVDDLESRLPQADILVRPSLTEGMPLAVLEAMGCGVCVIATDVAGNRDLIENDDNGVLVPPHQPALLAQAIAALLRDPARRARLAAAGRHTAGRYSWEATTQATATVLLEATGATGSREAA